MSPVHYKIGLKISGIKLTLLKLGIMAMISVNQVDKVYIEIVLFLGHNHMYLKFENSNLFPFLILKQYILSLLINHSNSYELKNKVNVIIQ